MFLTETVHSCFQLEVYSLHLYQVRRASLALLQSSEENALVFPSFGVGAPLHGYFDDVLIILNLLSL